MVMACERGINREITTVRNSKELPMRLIGLMFVAGLLTSFGYRCSSTSTVNKMVTNDSSDLSKLHVYNDRQEMETDIKDRREAVLQLLDRESERFALRSLKNRQAETGSEIRVWVGFSLAYSRCFIYQKRQEEREATYVGPEILAGRAAKDKNGRILLPKRTLNAPRFGWSNFDELLRQSGITSPLALAMDEQYIAVPDGEIIVIEERSGEEYSMIFYSVFTNSSDGQKALQVCSKIEEEFGINMACSKQK